MSGTPSDERDTPGRPVLLRRILVALDASAASLSALDAAADLAARLHAELMGLFVEDINLLRLAELSFVPEVSLTARAGPPLEPAALEAQLSALGAQARAALEQAARRRHLRFSFRVARGAVASEVLAAAPEADLLILGRAGRSLSLRRARLGGTAHAAAERAGCVLLLPPGATLDRPVLAVYDAAPTAHKALALALGLSRALGRGLLVLVSEDDDARAVELEADVARAAGQTPGGVACRRLPRPHLERVQVVLQAQSASLLVLGADSPLLADVGVREFLERVPGPVLLAR